MIQNKYWRLVKEADCSSEVWVQQGTPKENMRVLEIVLLIEKVVYSKCVYCFNRIHSLGVY
jgi:hypothetical protein